MNADSSAQSKTEYHSKFRRTKEWKNFRKLMLKKYPCCKFCNSNRATRTVHHIFNCKSLEDYTDLSEERFIVLCSQCHNFLHWVCRKKNESKAINEIKKIAEEIGFGTDWIKY